MRPAVGAIVAVARHELRALLGSPMVLVLLATASAVDALLLCTWATDSSQRPAAEVLERLLFGMGGSTMAMATLLGARALASARGDGLVPLLLASPMPAAHIVLGEFAAGSALMLVRLVLGAPLGAAIVCASAGSVAPGHLAVGLVGLLLLGGSCQAIATLASAHAAQPAAATALGTAGVGGMTLMWLVARAAPPAWQPALATLALHDQHARRLGQGILALEDVALYLGLIAACLIWSTHALEARRWR